MVTGSDKYRLGERIGGGGMAEVFLATLSGAEGFARRVAIKRVLPALSADAAFSEMFVNEARIASLLSHPNVVSVLDFDRDAAGRLFLVMEHVAGRDLRELMHSGPLPVPIAAHITAEVLRALAYAHELAHDGRRLEIVHRDVSPHNVLLSWDGAVKLSDFGIAKAFAATGASATGSVKGKVGYMSPEQAHGRRLDGRADLFAVGVMLHEMLTGERLFAGATEAEVFAQMLAKPIPHPRERCLEIPADLDAVTMRLVERDPNARFGTATAALEALLACESMSVRGGIGLAALLRERFAADAPAGPQLASQPAAVPIGTGTAPATPGSRELAAAMNAPTRTAYAATTGGPTPTAARQAQTSPAPALRARGWRIAAALAVLAAAVAWPVINRWRSEDPPPVRPAVQPAPAPIQPEHRATGLAPPAVVPADAGIEPDDRRSRTRPPDRRIVEPDAGAARRAPATEAKRRRPDWDVDLGGTSPDEVPIH